MVLSTDYLLFVVWNSGIQGFISAQFDVATSALADTRSNRGILERDLLNFASRDLFNRPRVAGQSGAAHVAHFVAVEAAGAVHRRAVVPHDEIVGPP